MKHGMVMSVGDLAAEVLAYFDRMEDYEPIPAGYPERFKVIRRNYEAFARHVESGQESWLDHSSVYEIGDWGALMTPIESAIWQDIRQMGLPLWPQLPVGRVFVDFGNPVKRVAVECDGAAWHDAAKDAKRDAYLGEMGWRVYRITGRDCRTDEGSDVMRQIAAHFEGVSA